MAYCGLNLTLKMQCCDRCKLNKPIVNRLKIKGKEFELCEDCGTLVGAYIQFSFEPPGFFGRILNKFGAGE